MTVDNQFVNPELVEKILKTADLRESEKDIVRSRFWRKPRGSEFQGTCSVCHKPVFVKYDNIYHDEAGFNEYTARCYHCHHLLRWNDCHWR